MPRSTLCWPVLSLCSQLATQRRSTRLSSAVSTVVSSSKLPDLLSSMRARTGPLRSRGMSLSRKPIRFQTSSPKPRRCGPCGPMYSKCPSSTSSANGMACVPSTTRRYCSRPRSSSRVRSETSLSRRSFSVRSICRRSSNMRTTSDIMTLKECASASRMANSSTTAVDIAGNCAARKRAEAMCSVDSASNTWPDGAVADRHLAHRHQHAIVGEFRVARIRERRRKVGVAREQLSAGGVDRDAVDIAIAQQRRDDRIRRASASSDATAS